MPMNRHIILAALFAVLLPALAQSAGAPQPPSVIYGALYRAVQTQGIFPDQKTFADAIPREAASTIMADYARRKTEPHFSLRAFVADHFRLPRRQIPQVQREHQNIRDYIRRTWSVLRRPPDRAEPGSSLLPLPHPYIVPGGRFSEIYYWDSYFTMLGLVQDGQDELARQMLANIAHLIARYGHMPNGNRSYYLSRSQPPFFASMIELLAARDGNRVLQRYLPELQSEYDYWMDGAEGLAAGSAHRHVARLADGTLLNRYWDDRNTPRDESWSQDVATARQSNRAAGQVYRDLRAGAESGWDFSSRWLAPGGRLATIHTTEIAPVDLNCLMQHMEQVLAKAYGAAGNRAKADLYARRARIRAADIRRLFWNEQAGLYADYLWKAGHRGAVFTAATVYPLYFGIATPAQAHAIAAALRKNFLKPGGLATTTERTGQQWDRPNGWAPLQYLAVEGLKRYHENALAETIARRWMARVSRSYARTGVLQEKYDIESEKVRPASGGEYELQIGFGWTNGVMARLMEEYY
jgi:alpha,alpha-trehalase